MTILYLASANSLVASLILLTKAMISTFKPAISLNNLASYFSY